MTDRATAAQLARIEMKLDLLLAGRTDRRRADFCAAVHEYMHGDPWCCRWLTDAAADPGAASASLRAAIVALVGDEKEGAARRLGSWVGDAIGIGDTWSLEYVGLHRDGLLYRVSSLA